MSRITPIAVALLSVAMVLPTASADAKGPGAPPHAPTAPAPQETPGARLVVQRGHSDAPRATLSPDGTLIVTHQLDGLVILWHAESGAMLRRLPSTGSRIEEVRFSPSGDRITIAFPDGSARVIRSDGEVIADFQHGGPKRTEFVALSPDASRVLTMDSSGQVQLWDIGRGDLLHTWKWEGPKRIRVWGGLALSPRGAFSPDGSRVVVNTGHRDIRVWDTRSGALAHHVGFPKAIRAYHLALTRDGKRLLAWGGGFALVWDLATGELVHDFRCADDENNSVWISPDGRFVVERDYPDLVIHDVQTDRNPQRIDGEDGFLESLEFSEDGSRIFVARNRRGAQGSGLWQWEIGAAAPQEKRVEPCSVEIKRVSTLNGPGGTALVTCEDGSVVLADREAGEVLARLRSAATGVVSVSESVDGGTLRIIRNDSSAALWDLADGRIGHWIPGRAPETGLHSWTRERTSAEFSVDGTRLITQWRAGETSIRDAETGANIHTLGTPGYWVRRTWWGRFSPDGRYVLAGSAGGMSVRTADRRGRWVRDVKLPKRIGAGAVSPDGTILFAAPERTRGIAWDMNTRRRLYRMKGPHTNIYQATFSPDSERIGTFNSRTASLWDASNGKHLLRFEGHNGWVNSLSFSTDSRWAITASGDRTAAIWASGTGVERVRLRGHTDEVTGAFFRRSSAHVVTSGQDGTVRLWDRDDGTLLASLVAFDDQTWAVVDPSGRFDASDDGDVRGLHWVIDDTPYDLAQLRDHYYDPGLLAKILGYRDDPLREVPSLDSIVPLPGDN